MMKPDTPKFVSDNRIMLWARQIDAELNFIREKQKHGGLKAAEMQTTILTERYAELLDFALRGIKADLVAAPKPDCVGVEDKLTNNEIHEAIKSLHAYYPVTRTMEMAMVLEAAKRYADGPVYEFNGKPYSRRQLEANNIRLCERIDALRHLLSPHLTDSAIDDRLNELLAVKEKAQERGEETK